MRSEHRGPPRAHTPQRTTCGETPFECGTQTCGQGRWALAAARWPLARGFGSDHGQRSGVKIAAGRPKKRKHGSHLHRGQVIQREAPQAKACHDGHHAPPGLDADDAPVVKASHGVRDGDAAGHDGGLPVQEPGGQSRAGPWSDGSLSPPRFGSGTGCTPTPSAEQLQEVAA